MKEKPSIEFDDIMQILEEKGGRFTESKYKIQKDETAQKY